MRRALLLAAVALAGCQPGLTDDGEIAALDEAYFRCRVQPILTKSCGTFTCHGAGDRFFTIFGRNRLRISQSEADRASFMTAEERQHNFQAALAMVDLDDPRASLLLLKPLEADVGGYFHQGAHEPFGGGDVFASEDDRDYQTILTWIEGATEDPTCVEPGSDR